jgi:predicted XRE-type DNA-binding protein
MSSGDVSITVGSGNVFADLGLANAEERLVKARLASRIQDGVEARGWSLEQAAVACSLSEADAARLARGALKGFSVAELEWFLAVVEGAR